MKTPTPSEGGEGERGGEGNERGEERGEGRGKMGKSRRERETWFCRPLRSSELDLLVVDLERAHQVFHDTINHTMQSIGRRACV